MAHTAPILLRLLASSVPVAKRAGEIIRNIMSRGELGIVDKGVNDLQTEADRSAQKCIVASLVNKFPNLTVIGEEGHINAEEVPSDYLVNEIDAEVLSHPCPEQFSGVQLDDIVVWVDPLDGTSEYTQGLVECVTVLIGLSVKGKPVAGVIHQPFYSLTKETDSEPTGRTIWGLTGAGIGGFQPVNPPANSFIITTTRSHSNKIIQDAVDCMQPTEVVRIGGAGQKVLLLMEGKAHAYVFASKGTKKWDTCAPEAVLRAAGGQLTDIYGSCYDYSKNATQGNLQGLIATPSSVNHTEILNKLTDEVRAALLTKNP